MSRGLKSAALLAAVVLAQAGCSKVTTSVGPGNGQAHSWTQPGVLRLSDISDPSTLNPMLTGADVAYQLASYTLEYLAQLDDQGNVVPVLCERLPSLENGDISKDGLTVTYHLRRNVDWSDGKPFTADDIIASWKQVVNPLNNVQEREGYDVIARIDAPDPHTAVVHLKRPYAPLTTRFFTAIQEGPIAVMPAHIIAGQADLNRSPFNTHPVGTGPFIMQSWERNGRMVFVANPHYWRGAPKLHEIDFQAQPSTATEFVRFQTHEIDADLDAGASRLPEYRTLKGMNVMPSTSLRLLEGAMFTQSFPFNDVHVRHAFAYAMDRRAILHELYHDAGVVADEFLPRWSWAYTPDVPQYPYDVTKSRAELEAAGFKVGPDGYRYRDGRKLSIVLVAISGSGSSAQLAALTQSYLKAVGFQTEIKNYPYGIVFDISGPIRTGKFNLSFFSYSVNYDPSSLDDDGCDQFSPKGANDPRFCDTVVDRLEREGLVTTAVSARKSIYAEIQKRRVAALPEFPIIFLNRVGVANVDLHGYTASRGIIPQWNAWRWSLP